MIFVHQVLNTFELITKPGVHKIMAFVQSLAVLGVLIKFDCSFLKEVICDLLVLFDILELLICAFDEFLMAYLLICELIIDLFCSLDDSLLDIRSPFLQRSDFFL